MVYGETAHAAATDPLLASYFWLATVANFIPALFASPVPIEWGVVGSIHLLFILRVGVARRQAARQRAIDLERFRQLKAPKPRRQQQFIFSWLFLSQGDHQEDRVLRAFPRIGRVVRFAQAVRV